MMLPQKKDITIYANTFIEVKKMSGSRLGWGDGSARQQLPSMQW